MQLKMNKYTEQDLVGRETIDIINKQAERSEISASHYNKTDRFQSRGFARSPDNPKTEDNGKGELQRVKSGLAARNKAVFMQTGNELA